MQGSFTQLAPVHNTNYAQCTHITVIAFDSLRAQKQAQDSVFGALSTTLVQQLVAITQQE